MLCPPGLLFCPPWTFETMVSAITGWKLFTEENHITEDCLLYALCIFKCVHCLKKLEVNLGSLIFVSRSKYSNRAVTILIKQSLNLITTLSTASPI